MTGLASEKAGFFFGRALSSLAVPRVGCCRTLRFLLVAALGGSPTLLLVYPCRGGALVGEWTYQRRFASFKRDLDAVLAVPKDPTIGLRRRLDLFAHTLPFRASRLDPPSRAEVAQTTRCLDDDRRLAAVLTLNGEFEFAIAFADQAFPAGLDQVKWIALSAHPSAARSAAGPAGDQPD
jgi:hypothetical protein